MSEQTPEKTFEAALRHQRQGDARQAEALYRRVLGLAPDHADSFNNLGVLLHEQGRMDEALVCYFNALKVKRGAPHYYGNLGNTLAGMGRLDEAAFAYRHAADLLRKSGKWTAAVPLYERALGVTPADTSIRFRLGIALLRLNRHAEALSQFDRVLASAGEFANYARFLVAGTSVAEVNIDGKVLRFRVGQMANNVGVDMCHVNGQLYEQEELTYCRTKVKPRMGIVDVGANTGNHLVYFAGFLDPSTIVPVEFHPEAIRQLRENIALNGITCVDDCCLGVGAGASHGRFTRVEDVDWAQAALVPSVNGNVRVAPLDDLIAISVGFMKVDVEGMEIGVLNGARKLMSTFRPQIMIEVQERNIEPFKALVGQLGYVVDRQFAHPGYINYFLVPAA